MMWYIRCFVAKKSSLNVHAVKNFAWIVIIDSVSSFLFFCSSPA
jgi:hypothetical protein